MEKIKDKILAIIRKKSLSSFDSKNWQLVLGNLPEELCVDILAFIENNSGGLKILTDNLNKKVKALDEKDAEKWEEILEEEMQLFQKSKSR